MGKTAKLRSTEPTLQRDSGPSWTLLLIVAFASVAVGALGMWAWMRAHSPAIAIASAPSQPVSGRNPENHEPAPELTAGMAPAQAARVRGDFFYDHSNWTRAIADYQLAIRQGSDDADIRTDLANALQFSGRGPDAVVQYEAAQRLNPQHEASLFNLGVCFADTMGDPAKAIETWQQFLQRFPASSKAADARRMIGMAQAALAGGTPAVPAMAGSSAQGSGSGASTSDADMQRMMQLIKKDERPVPARP